MSSPGPDGDADRDGDRGGGRGDTARYVYAVARATDVGDDDVAGLTGIAGTPVRLVGEGELVAVVGDVDRTGLASMEQGVDDLARLAADARAHHHVVDTLGRGHTVAPLSLATVYFDDDRVREVLRGGHDALLDLLRQLAGRSEWGIKVWVRSGTSAGTAEERPRTGADYLRRRRQALRDREQGVDDASRAADEVHERASAIADDVRRHRPQESALTGREERQVLNGAYLTDAEGAAALRGLVAELADHPRLQVEMTGPWVPYSFVRGPDPA